MMMTATRFTLLLLALSMLTVGCGVPKTEHEKVVNQLEMASQEKASLTDQLDQVTKERATLAQQVAQLEKENRELKAKASSRTAPAVKSPAATTKKR